MSQTTPQLAIDPVCGMKIDPEKAVGSSQYNGQTYLFCSRGCEMKFDDAPDQFAGKSVLASAACCSTGKHSCC